MACAWISLGNVMEIEFPKVKNFKIPAGSKISKILGDPPQYKNSLSDPYPGYIGQGSPLARRPAGVVGLPGRDAPVQAPAG